MNNQFLYLTIIAIDWWGKLAKKFHNIAPGWSAMATASLTFGRFTRMIAFLLPLKVILLAGSDGVPRYFRFIISEENKEPAIAILAVSAIVFYILTLFLQAAAEASIKRGSARVQAEFADSDIGPEQFENSYRRTMQATSSAFFVLLASGVLIWLNLALFLFLFVLMAGFFVCTCLVLTSEQKGVARRMKDFMSESYRNYLEVISSISYLSAFLFILAPFITGGGGHIIVAIVAFMLTRQLFNAMSRGVKDIVFLAAKKEQLSILA